MLSRLCGFCSFDSNPAPPAQAAAVRAALRSARTSSDVYTAAGIVIGCAAWSAEAAEPDFHLATDGSCCSWDGRLDNRDDLLLRTGLPENASDSSIVWELYRRSGEEGFRDLIGDWSLCLWDAAARAVVLASDYAGVRPLYYHARSGKLWWSSVLADLPPWTHVNELDDTYAASFLLHGSGGSRTPYSGIFTVPPGHSVRVSERGVVSREFWNLPVGERIRYSNEESYAERMLELFREAVHVRIRNSGVICAELSGGLDSSSAVCMAHTLCREGPARLKQLRTFSYTHANCPDEPYFREVERSCGISGSHLDLQNFPPVVCGIAGGSPAWWRPRFDELARRVSECSADVFLTGQFGDLITGNVVDDSGQVAEWIAARNFRRAGKEAYDWARSMGVPLYPILWRGLRQAYSSWLPASGPEDGAGAIRGSAETSISARLLSAFEMNRSRDTAPWAEAPPGRRRHFRDVYETLQSRVLQAPEPLQHIAWTHPFSHRPLVEYLLAVPASQVCAPGQPRRLMRRAFVPFLPPLILNRKSKAAYVSTYRDALMRLASSLAADTSNIEVVERGWIDRASLLARVERFRQGLDCNEPQLRQVLLFEFWLRNREASRVNQPPPPLISSMAPSR